MPFLPPNQQCQSTEGILQQTKGNGLKGTFYLQHFWKRRNFNGYCFETDTISRCCTNVYCSKQQESAKSASSGPVTPGTSSQPSPPLPQSATPVTTTTAAATASSGDVKSATALTDIKEECKTPGLASLSSGNLTATSTGFGFNVSLDKDEAKVHFDFWTTNVVS